MSKSVYYEDKDFVLTVEMFNELPFIHLNLHRASKEIIDRVMKKWAEVKALAYFEGYEKIYTYTKDERMFKFFCPDKVYDEGFPHRGETYKVAEWELN